VRESHGGVAGESRFDGGEGPSRWRMTVLVVLSKPSAPRCRGCADAPVRAEDGEQLAAGEVVGEEISLGVERKSPFNIQLSVSPC